MLGAMPTRSFALALVAAAAAAASILALGERTPRLPAVPPARAPLAFWAWRARTPSPASVRRAAGEAGATDLYLRASQFDWDGGAVARIRAVEGAMPSELRLHLVYHATHTLLDAFGRIDARTFATAIGRTATDDTARARADGADVVGVQLDLDVPTRLLPAYGVLLRATRASVPPGLELSVTGLPTWLSSPGLAEALDAVDFWIPQCHGAEFPMRVDRHIPIAAPAAVRRAVAAAEAVGRPYMVGLAAYGYALHYDASGALVELRGDLDPALVAGVVNLELVERQPYPDAPGEWRLGYRATAPCAVDGVALGTGDTLVVEEPTAEWLRTCARSAREPTGSRPRTFSAMPAKVRDRALRDARRSCASRAPRSARPRRCEYGCTRRRTRRTSWRSQSKRKRTPDHGATSDTWRSKSNEARSREARRVGRDARPRRGSCARLQLA
jgi:hypothetical protein